MVNYSKVFWKAMCYFKWGGVDNWESQTWNEKMNLENSWEANIAEKEKQLQGPRLVVSLVWQKTSKEAMMVCLLYTSDAADETSTV